MRTNLSNLIKILFLGRSSPPSPPPLPSANCVQKLQSGSTKIFSFISNLQGLLDKELGKVKGNFTVSGSCNLLQYHDFFKEILIIIILSFCFWNSAPQNVFNLIFFLLTNFSVVVLVKLFIIWKKVYHQYEILS